MIYDILLQGFHWDSHNVQGKSWYQIIEENADRIKKSGFTIVWFPPPSDSVDRQGYIPRELNKLESNYGNEVELKDSIANLSP
ncbi:MAG: alpha-amylase, partial [Pseudanabaena sp.]